MDNKDKKIIKILSKDSRTPYTVIAKKIKLSESSVRKRVMNLEKNGIIEKFTIIINPAKVGYNTVAIIGLDVDPSKFLEITSKMTKFNEVKYVATSTGDHMIMLEIESWILIRR